MSKLDYVPSWINGARTLLEKINLCIDKIEEINLDHASKEEVETLKNNVTEIRNEVDFINATLEVQNLIGKFEGSDTVVVDLNEMGDKIEIHLDGEVIGKIDRALLLPLSILSNGAIPYVNSGNSLEYINIEKNFFKKLWRHNFYWQITASDLGHDLILYNQLISGSSGQVNSGNLTTIFASSFDRCGFCGETETGQIYPYRVELTGQGSYKFIVEVMGVLHEYSVTNPTVVDNPSIIFYG